MPTYKIANATPAFGGKPSKFGSQKYSVNLSLEGVTEQPLFEVASLDDIDNGAGLAGKTVAGEIQSKKSENGHVWSKFVGALVDGPAAPAANSSPASSNGDARTVDARIEDQVIFKGAVELAKGPGNFSDEDLVLRAIKMMEAVKRRHDRRNSPEPVAAEVPF